MKHRYIALLTIISLFIPCFSFAQEIEADVDHSWKINGQNTSKFEYYSRTGNITNAPYQKDGDQMYDELHLTLNRQLSEWEFFSSNIDLLYNDSAYRGTLKGFVPERFKFTWEKGDATVPFRTEFGDINPFVSVRTFQRSLKGLRLEFQHPGTDPETRRSLMFFSGTAASNYQDIVWGRNQFSGVSWVVETDNHGNLGVHIVQNHQDDHPSQNTPELNQTVISVTGNKRYETDKYRLTLETELASFNGDYRNGTRLFYNRFARGYFTQIRGERLRNKFTYRLKWEEYERDYRPTGATAASDHKAWEYHMSWRLKNNNILRFRHQFFADGTSSTNPLWNHITGLNLSGKLGKKGDKDVTGSIDVFGQDSHNGQNTVDYRLKAANLNFSIPMASWTTNVSLRARETRDFSTAKLPTQSLYETNISATKAFYSSKDKNLRYTLSPGIIWQTMDGNNTDRHNYGFNLGFGLSKPHHNLGVNYRYMVQNPHVIGTIDDINNSLSLNYTYTKDDHIIGFDADVYRTSIDPGENTKAYRVALWYTYKFDNQRRVKPVSDMAPASREGFPSLLGVDMGEAVQMLDQAGVVGASYQNDYVVYDTNILDQVDQRQRFALLQKAGKVDKTVLVIDFDDTSSIRTVADNYNQVVGRLYEKLGEPTNVYDQGDFTNSLVTDLDIGRFARVVEWQTNSGVIRFGIPVRLDKQLRMEMQFAESFPPISTKFTSIEEIR